VGMVTIRTNNLTLLVVTAGGYGKRSKIEDYRQTRRGGKGIITMKLTEKTGKLVSIMEVRDSDDLMIISTGGIIMRQSIKKIRSMGRNTQGVRLINLKGEQKIADVAKIIKEDETKNVDTITDEE
ncbi:DNA gyrase subunit A, partial [bacterium]|nr:DNA gyrase subunit A [bacterium]